MTARKIWWIERSHREDHEKYHSLDSNEARMRELLRKLNDPSRHYGTASARPYTLHCALELPDDST